MNTQNLLVKEYMTDALFILMKSNPYDAISVTDITKKAGVSRMAFYRNYETKDDIIDTYFHNQLFDLMNHFREEKHSHDENLIDFLNLIRSSKKVLQLLIHCEAAHLIVKNYMEIIQHIILNHYQIYHPTHIPSGYQLDFLVGGLLHVILSWAKKDSPEDDNALEELFMNLELFIRP